MKGKASSPPPSPPLPSLFQRVAVRLSLVTLAGIALIYVWMDVAIIARGGRSLGPDDILDGRLWQEFLARFGWLVAPFLAILLGISIITVRRTLSPLRELSERAAEIGPSAADVRLPTANVPTEILPLVEAMNKALDRLDAGLRIQREFTADAAHELRTPLAVLAAQVDLLEDRQAAAALRRDLDGMARLVAQLLKVAQLDVLTFPAGEQADLAKIASDVAGFLAPLAVSAGKSLEVDAEKDSIPVHGHVEAIVGAVRNLVENAIAHTAPGTLVTVQVTVEPAVHVIDHGEGVPPAQREQIFRRFWRADRNRGGAGLGLAIVRKTMETHGGEARVSETPGGGATFSLIFPPPRRS
ncbi:MAG: sensor histidine kinase [Alphaproteobacteria bacterium]